MLISKIQYQLVLPTKGDEVVFGIILIHIFLDPQNQKIEVTDEGSKNSHSSWSQTMKKQKRKIYTRYSEYTFCCSCEHINSSPQCSPWSQDRL